VYAALDAWGADAFRREWLSLVAAHEPLDPGEIQPFYERYGEQRVADGAYGEVIRYRSHIRPLAAALNVRVARSPQ
jgi:hypothetical protein